MRQQVEKKFIQKNNGNFFPFSFKNPFSAKIKFEKKKRSQAFFFNFECELNFKWKSSCRKDCK